MGEVFSTGTFAIAVITTVMAIWSQRYGAVKRAAEFQSQVRELDQELKESFSGTRDELALKVEEVEFKPDEARSDSEKELERLWRLRSRLVDSSVNLLKPWYVRLTRPLLSGGVLLLGVGLVSLLAQYLIDRIDMGEPYGPTFILKIAGYCLLAGFFAWGGNELSQAVSLPDGMRVLRLVVGLCQVVVVLFLALLVAELIGFVFFLSTPEAVETAGNMLVLGVVV
ncbi:MAG: hypothetical protein QM705_11130 [Ancrocorticia sp.]